MSKLLLPREERRHLIDSGAYFNDPGRFLIHAQAEQYFHGKVDSGIIPIDGVWFIRSRLPHSVKGPRLPSEREFVTHLCEFRGRNKIMYLHDRYFNSLKRSD